MATKYASLIGVIPQEVKPPTERDTKVAAERATIVDRTMLNLTGLYNRAVSEADDLAVKTAAVNIRIDAYEGLIQEQLEACGADSMRINGFTWGPKVEPYPSADDPAVIVQYFKDNGMEDQLTLNKTELASRLKAFVKEEALANELIIEAKTVTDATTGAESQVNEVRSKIPGVLVYLRSSLSRVRSNK